jgi:hypothetical protein
VSVEVKASVLDIFVDNANIPAFFFETFGIAVDRVDDTV